MCVYTWTLTNRCTHALIIVFMCIYSSHVLRTACMHIFLHCACIINCACVHVQHVRPHTQTIARFGAFTCAHTHYTGSAKCAHTFAFSLRIYKIAQVCSTYMHTHTYIRALKSIYIYIYIYSLIDCTRPAEYAHTYAIIAIIPYIAHVCMYTCIHSQTHKLTKGQLHMRESALHILPTAHTHI